MEKKQDLVLEVRIDTDVPSLWLHQNVFQAFERLWEQSHAFHVFSVERVPDGSWRNLFLALQYEDFGNSYQSEFA